MTEILSTYPAVAWLALLATGVLIGLLAGLLGVGGGVVAVPVLLELFLHMGMIEATAVPLAVGTAQASILIASLTAAWAHWRRGTIDRPLVIAWLPALIAGTLAGLVLGAWAPARTLTIIFAAVAAFLALKMALGDRLVLTRARLAGPIAQAPPLAVGMLAAAVGVGAGTLSTPVLSLFDFPIKRAVGAGALFNLIVALPATVTLLVLGLGAPGRPPDAVGNVAVACMLALAIPALFVAPLAARWSTRAPVPLLRALFALCLAAIALRLLLRL
ncbi:MAG TPA: sulfite exporter TauE/SafE family protein [Reyranellaceae bacterium]|nr:sulfite exporter TauE/SafE family protein [Reyranellaceae bacterium]